VVLVDSLLAVGVAAVSLGLGLSAALAVLADFGTPSHPLMAVIQFSHP
jgi:hypothetical protein